MMMKMRNMMKRKNNQKGFTLIELIVVMAILAVLAAIAVPRYNGILDDAKVKTDQANLRMLQNAVDVYTAQHNGTAPVTFDSLSPSILKEIPVQQTPSGVEFTLNSGGTVTQ